MSTDTGTNEQLFGASSSSQSSLSRACRDVTVSDTVGNWEGEESSDFVLNAPRFESSRYEIVDELSVGGIGTVFRAIDVWRSRDVAIKVLRPKYAANSSARAVFANEAAMMQFLVHPGIPPIYESGYCSDDRPFHVMELIEGVALSSILSAGEHHDADVMAFIGHVCETMAFAHSSGVVHRDLKPGNVMVGASGDVWVTDWGLAFFAEELSDQIDMELPEVGLIAPTCGTPEYMAPEQSRGEGVDARSDVFGLGAIMCEAIVGHSPFWGATVRDVYVQSARGKIDCVINEIRQSKHMEPLAELATRCLSSDPADRPRSAGVVAEELRSLKKK